MSELTPETIAEIAAQAATEAVAKLKEVERKVTPGDDDTTIAVVKSPEEKLFEDPKGGFKNLSHYFRDLIRAEIPGQTPTEALRDWDNACRKTAGYMEEGDLSQGGYLVPTQFLATLLATSLEGSIVESRATKIPMQTNRVEIPALVDSDHSSNYFGGITIYRRAELASATVTNPTFFKRALTLHTLSGATYVTNELIADSPISIEPIIKATFGQAISFVKDYDFLRGTGADQALGVFHANSPCSVSVAKETNQVADTIAAENILKMWSRLYPPCHAKAVWVANIDTFPQLAVLSIAVGTGGVPIWIPGNDLSKAPHGTLLGRPLLLTEKMDTLGNVYDIGLADFSQYLIGEKAAGPDFASSMHVRFMTNEQTFRFNLRYDGTPWWNSALTPKSGSSNTLSPFVYLAERA